MPPDPDRDRGFHCNRWRTGKDLTEASDRRRTALRGFLAGPIARATLLSLAIRIGGLALGFLQAILTARLLGPDGYGAVAYVFSLSMILSAVALLGTETLAVREVARLKALGDAAALGGLLRSIRRLTLGVSLLGALAVALLLPRIGRHDPAFSAVILFPALLFPLLAFILQTQGILRGYGKVAMAQVPFQVVRPAVMTATLALAWLLGTGFSARAYLIAALAAATLALALALRALAGERKSATVAPAPPPLREILTRATPFFTVSVLTLVLGEINNLMLGWWADAEQTGLFQPIARIAPLIMLGVQAAGIAYAPRVSALSSTGESDLLVRITRKFTLTTTAFALAVALLTVLLGEPILALFGKAFATNTAALWWVAAAQVFNAACGPVGMLLTMSQRANRAIPPQLASLGATLALGYLLIPDLGAIGAAIAFSGGIVTANVGMWIAVRRTMGFDPSMLMFIAPLRRSARR